MITLILLLGLIVALTIKKRSDKKDKAKPFYIRYRSTIILAAIAFLPAVYINVFHQNSRQLSERERFDKIIERGHFYSSEEVYNEALSKYPDSVELRFDLIDLIMKFDHYDHESLQTKVYSPNQKVQNLTLAYLSARYFSQWEHTYPEIDGDAPFENYVLGTKAIAHDQPELVKKYLLKETKLNPNFKRAHVELIEYSEAYLQEDYKRFSVDPEHAKFLPLSIQRRNYFLSADIINYFIVISHRTFDNLEFIAFIAALLISIVWLIFLRSMDVYNKEKWVDIIAVFILGAIFTNLCLIGYDYAHYVLGFTFNSEPWNNFWYCTFVIGGSEEIVKFIPWIAFLFLTKKAKEPYDYLLYASVSALGFAFVENFSYLENPGNIVLRSIMSTIGHMFDASVIAYSIILAKYRVKDKKLKIALPFIGFFLAILSHGFYDFWLMSPTFSNGSILTLIFFIISVHLWFVLHNNAINNSPFYKKSVFNSDTQLNVITIGIIGILMLEYVITGQRHGSEVANQNISSFGWIVVVFISYMTVILARIKIMPGVWSKYRFVMPEFIKSSLAMFTPDAYTLNKEEDNETTYFGLELKLFVQKSNRYVADKFPVSGFCDETIMLSGSTDWHIFRLNNDISYAGYQSDKVIIRAKDKQEKLTEDKVEIILLFIPVGTYLRGEGLRVEDLRFTGKAFARPN